jgi:phage baseplate assembly protein W
MAVIDLNNIVRPKQTYSPSTNVTQVVNINQFVYKDLHLDLIESKNIGLGLNAVNTSDILVDIDIQAIQNSIRNIFTTKKGQKILNPDFGSCLDQYLFTPISKANAKAIGNDILNSVSLYEPRIKINNVIVTPMFDQNQYYIVTHYTILEINKQNVINIIAQLGGQVLI